MAKRRKQRDRKVELLRIAGGIGVALLILWALNGSSSGGVLLVMAACAALVVFVSNIFLDLGSRRCSWQNAAIGVLLALLVAVPVVFDSTTADVFNLTKFTIVLIGSLVLAFLVIGDRIQHGHRFLWRNGLQWPLLAFLAWTLVATLANPSIRVGLVGFYKSYDGFISHLAFVFLFFTIVHVVTINDIRPILSVLFLGAGGLVVLYGIAQIHDLTFQEATWDWVEWGSSPGGFSAIWSGLGNPNHLGGFLAMLLPIGLVLLLSSQSLKLRAVTGVVVVASILEIVLTTNRGAWFAVIVSVPFLLVLLIHDARSLPRLSIPIVGVVLVGVIAAALLLGPRRDISEIVGSIFESGERSTLALRFELWGSGLEMASDRPVVGFGPDAYRFNFPRYQSEQFVEWEGPTAPANGPHNIFVNYLVTEGVPGLFAFLAVVAFAALRTFAAFKRIRAMEERSSAGELTSLRDSRLMLAGVSAGVLAYLIQASFNVQQIALSFLFWSLLALVTSIALDVGVPSAFNPLVALRAVSDETVAQPRVSGSKRRRKTKSIEGSRVHLPVSQSRLSGKATTPSPAIRTAALGGSLLLLVALTVIASRPYRADGIYLEARRAAGDASDTDDSTEDRQNDYRRALELFDSAVTTDPWETLYSGSAAEVASDFSDFLAENPELNAETELEMLQEARRYSERSLEVRPQNPFIQRSYGQVLLEIYRLDPSSSTLERAMAAFDASLRANPWDPETVTVAVTALIEQDELERARSVLAAAPAYVRADEEVEAAAARLEDSG